MAGRHGKSRASSVAKAIKGTPVRTMASVLGLVVLGGGFVASSVFTDGFKASPDMVERPSVVQAASRSVDRRDLLTEAVSTDVTGTWSLGVTEAEVKRNLDAQTKSNDSAAAAKDALGKALAEAKRLDVSGKTAASAEALEAAKDKAAKMLGGKTLRKAKEYDSMRTALKEAVDGLEDKPVLVVQQVEPGSGGDSSNSLVTKTDGSESFPVVSTLTAPVGEMQEYAHKRVLEMGWSEADFTELVWLWNRESGWNPNAHNASSGAHGIPQCLGHAECQTAAYQNDYKTQIEWGLNYIKGRYGSPSIAASHSRTVGWY